jgi:hypothetical protein
MAIENAPIWRGSLSCHEIDRARDNAAPASARRRKNTHHQVRNDGLQRSSLFFVLIFQAFKEERSQEWNEKGRRFKYIQKCTQTKTPATEFTQRKDFLSGAAEKAAIAP